jgi:multidrug efflux pump
MRLARRSFDWAQERYARSLDWALANRGTVLMLLLAAVLLNAYLMVIAPKGFFPQQDTGGINGGIRADQSISFSDMQNKLARLVRIVKADPAVATVVAFTGGSRAGGGFLFATLVPRDRRPAATAVIARLRPKLAQITGVTLFLNPVQDLRVGGRQTSSTYQYVLKAEDPDTLKAAGEKLVEALKQSGGSVTDVDIDQQAGGADAFVDINRDTAARLGVSMQSIDATLYDAFGQRQVANIYSGLNQYHVIMEADRQFNGSPQALANIYVPVASVGTGSTGSTTGGSANGGSATASGSAVRTSALTMAPLSAFSQWSTGSTNASVNHSDGEPSATISFNLPPGSTLSQAAQTIARVQAGLALPATVHGEFSGTAKVFQESAASMPTLILAALVAIYIVLGMLYESAIHPLTALSTLPSAGVGAMIALIITGGEFDVIALIGIILLIGIVKKNAILIIDFALEAERRGMSPLEAVREASLLRFRPILMTTLAAALGALPLAVGFGDGAELRRPLGVAIFGGLVASQILTLLTTPVVYLALDRFRHRGRSIAQPADKPITP